MSAPLTSRPRTGAEITRALGALVVLVLLVVGIPIALLVVAPGGIDVAELPGLLMRPDDGTLFLAALAGIAWLAWAVFALSVVVEAVAVVRGMPTPRMPGLGGPQRSAAVLVGAAAVLLTANPWQTIAPQMRPVVASAPMVAGTAPSAALAPSATTVAKPATVKKQHGPTVTVRQGDTLWSLADRHLGAGTRYRDIAELNYDRAQPDGRTLDHDHWIYPGWTLRLPTDASTDPGTDPDDRADIHVVRSGETLSGIAEAELGDAERYPEIARATRPIEQPNGAHLSDPDLILPGWTLRLHDEKTTLKPKPTSRAETRPPDDDATGASPSPPAKPPATTIRTSPPAVSGASTSEPGLSASTPTTSSSPTAPAVAEAPDLAADDEIAFPSRLVLGLGGLAAAGFIGHLALRRRRQQRVRRAGERIPMPDLAPAMTEQTLRAAQEPFTAADIRRALRALAAGCAETGRELPRLLFVRVTRESVYLTFAGDEPDPPTGFLPVNAKTWRIGDVHRRTDPASLTEPEPDADAFDPYPALVTLGVTDDEALLMANLEAAGTLTVAGAPDETRAVLLAMVAELSTSTLSENVGITLSGGLRGLAEVHDLTRVRATEDRRIGYLAGVHRREVVDVLTATPAVDVHYARNHRVAEDVWAPEVFAIDDAVPDVEPWLGTVILGCSENVGPGWTLSLNGGGLATLTPAGLAVEPQRLDDETYQHLLTLLATADADSVPAPVQIVPVLAADAGPTAVPVLPSAADAAPPPAPAAPSEASPPLPSTPIAPRLLVLGPVVVEGADDEALPSRRRRATELVAYLALHPGATTHQIDEAIWPGRRVGKQTRNSFVSRARHWLGRSPEGDPYLPLVATEGDYRLSPEVTCDWHDFQQLVAEGLAAGEGGAPKLEAALALVRGRPFLGVDPTTYAWAEADIQEMISVIVDAAHTLALLRLSVGDDRGAQQAAAKGLLCEPCSEQLYRDAMQAALARGDAVEAKRLLERLRAQIDLVDLESELEPETIDLIERVSDY